MIKEIMFNEFQEFVLKNDLSSHYQSINYAMLMTEYGFDYDLIGYYENDNLIAASLIIFKNITNLKRYGYAPRGFLIDYKNYHLLERFTKSLIKYYQKKNIVFIKINPELVVNEIDYKNDTYIKNKNQLIKTYLGELNYFKLKDNVYFESRLPRFNAIIDLKNYNINNIEKNTRTKIRRAEAKGLYYEIAEHSGVDILFDFIKKKRPKDLIYYKHYYNMFKKTGNVDIFLVGVDYNKYLLSAKKLYEDELDRNAIYNSKLISNNNTKNIHIKMESDKKLVSYKNDIVEATNGSKNNQYKYIAGAMVIKYKNKISIAMSGYDTKLKNFNANYFLHEAIIEHYKDEYDLLDLNGITGDFTDKNPYYGLNKFKLGFNPQIVELIGEYDLLIKPMAYKKLYNSGQLAKTLNRDDQKELIQFN